MAHAYTPGLEVTEATVIRKERRLPLKGEVIVKVGQKVNSEEIVARTHLPGNVELINVASKLSVEPKEVPEVMLKKEGDTVSKDEMIAQTKGFFGLFKGVCNAPKAGKIENISSVTGQVILREPPIPVEVTAYIDGVVDEIIEDEGVVVKAYGSFIQGIFGIGGEVTGELKAISETADEVLQANQITSDYKDKIIVTRFLVKYEAIQKAVKVGAKGIVAGGLDDSDLRKILGYDLGVAITGSEEIGVTVVVTEGFGKIKMAERTFDLLKKLEGKKASINGATQIRAGVIRPEIIIPLKEEISVEEAGEAEEDKGMDAGDQVRIIREPYFGLLAKVVSLPVDLHKLQTEAKVRVVEVELENGEKVILPRANVELIKTGKVKTGVSS